MLHLAQSVQPRKDKDTFIAQLNDGAILTKRIFEINADPHIRYSSGKIVEMTIA
jgi:hypothetical protein